MENNSNKSKAPIIIGVVCGVVCVAAVIIILFVTGVFGGKSEPAAEATPTPAPVVSEEPEATEAPTPEATEEPEPEPAEESTEEVAEDGFARPSREECRTLCEELAAGKPVKTKDKEDLLTMCNIVLPLILPKDEIYFFEDNPDCEYTSLYYLNGSGGEKIIKPVMKPSDTNGYVSKYKRKEVLDYWSKLYDRDPSIPITDSEGVEQTGKYVKFIFGDGEMGYYFSAKPKIYENDSYYMVAGKMEAEYDPNEKLKCRVLIRKRDWKLPGTIIYLMTEEE